jgi:hypothetical protein
MNMVVSGIRFVNLFSNQQDIAVNGRTAPY